MKHGKLIIEKNELSTILELIRNIGESGNLMNVCITRLRKELSTAEVMSDPGFPPDVVRLNSVVDIETPFGMMKAQLVLPHLSNSVQKKISLLTPMGSALLGYAEGDEVIWNFPNGEHLIRIVKVS